MTAAGSAITAAWINSDSAILTICGTSMPPHLSEFLLHSYCEGSKTQVHPLANE
jgi:hypothetical protein